MTVPVVVFPNPLRMALALLRNHEALPAALRTPVVSTGGSSTHRVCIRLPDPFPANCPYLQVRLITGGARVVPLRVAQAKIDLHVYHPDLFTCSDLAALVTAMAVSLEQRRTSEGGFTKVRVEEPFPLPDPDTALERYIIPITANYRPS